MSLIPVAAELIRRAAQDETYEQDLHDAVNSHEPAFAGLVRSYVEERELGWLTPSEWMWFARWRQGMGGELDERLLAYLEFAGSSRTSRFELRGLVMRDPDTNSAAAEADVAEPELGVGLAWLRSHALQFPDGLEIARDALQYATEAAWFTLRVLTSLGRDAGRQVAAELERIAVERELGRDVTSRWTQR